MLKKNDRVITNEGKGSVVFTRNKGPDYSKAEAVSVFLDKNYNKPGYTGTMFPVDMVSRIDHVKIEIHEDLINLVAIELSVTKEDFKRGASKEKEAGNADKSKELEDTASLLENFISELKEAL